MGETTSFFMRGIEVMAVYSLMISLLINVIPATDLNYLYELRASPAYVEVDSISTEFQSGIQQQQSFGVVEVGALALYSGNLLVDLILNFFGAIPSMASIIVNVILMFMNVSDPIKNAVLSFSYTIIGIIYLFSIIVMLLDIRSGTRGI